VEDREWPAYMAEFIGTFLLVFFVCTIVSINSAGGIGVTDFAVIGLLHAFILAMLVYTLGGTSGAHFNPAVTTTLLALRKIKPGDALVYVLVQLSGGVAGALVCKALVTDAGRGVHYGAVSVSQIVHGHALPGLIAEILGTFVLMWAIMGVAVNPRGQRDWAGLVIGITLGFAVMAFAPISGAGLNPARWFGPAVVGNEWGTWLIYIVGPIIGGLLAGFVYDRVVIAPANRVTDRPIDTLG
jgi:glycerol uptake facilitator protein